jgi:hypothetical protein
MNGRFFIAILLGFRPLSALFQARLRTVPVRPGCRATITPRLSARIFPDSFASITRRGQKQEQTKSTRRARADAVNAGYAIRHIQSARPC